MNKMYLNEKQALLYHSCLNNPKLSMKAKGLYMYILSMGDSNIKIKDIVKEYKDGRDSVLNEVNELINNGYILKGMVRDPDNGQFSWYEYTAHTIPELVK